MDGLKANLTQSLQAQLSAWLSGAVILLALGAGGYSFWSSFQEANKRQDERSSLMSLALSRWVEDGTAILVTGPTGSGKSWLACALAQYACRRGHSALYLRVPRLAEDLRVLHGNGGFGRWLGAVARTDVLLLDDWGLAAMDGPTRADLMEVIDDRAGTRPTIVTSQLPVEHWHAWIGDATVADAILDRLLSRSHRLNLKGKSMRQSKAAGNSSEGSDTTTPQDAAAA